MRHQILIKNTTSLEFKVKSKRSYKKLNGFYSHYDNNFKMIIVLLLFLLLNTNINKIENNKSKIKINIRFIFCGAPIHKNYGDEAIIMSTLQFLNFYFPQYEYIILSSIEISQSMRLIKYIINKNDIIIITGGGYFGLYENTISLQTKIVENFPNNSIIIFPCSIFYNPNKAKIYKNYLKIFNNHTDLTLFTRDNISYRTALRLFKNNSIYNVPDIVTRLNTSIIKNNSKRAGIGLILRRDELLLSHENRLYIIFLAKKYFKNEVYRRDSNNFFLPKESTRKNETIEFINFIAQKELIITDRLHGMIFSVITGTPCIVFGNNYHKIKSSYYSWFKDLEYVIFMEKNKIEKNLEKNIKRLKNSKNYKIFNYTNFEKYYSFMSNILQTKINISLNKTQNIV